MVKVIGLSQKDQEVLLYYTYEKNGKNYFKLVSSQDGFTFNGNTKYVIVTDEKKREDKNYDWSSFRAAKQKNTYIVTYKTPTKKDKSLTSVSSSDLIRLTKMGKIPSIQETGVIVPDFQYKKKYVMYFGEKNIKIAYSTNLKTWNPDEAALIEPRDNSFDNNDLEVAGTMLSDAGIILVYYVKKPAGNLIHYSVGACLFDTHEPTKLLWRSDEPLWEYPEQFKNDIFSPLGIAVLNEELILYWLVGETDVFAVSCPMPGTHVAKKEFSIHLKKSAQNPIITPRSNRRWESRATFNSAAIYEDGKIHFVYRALGDSDLSVLGYATSKDGITIDYRSDEPIYIPREPFETPGGNRFKTFADHFASGGGYGGIEDPRITKIDDKMYMTYVAFDGANPPRVALTSIGVDDFLNRRWENWETPKLISAPGMVNKNAVIFPEKINGKFVVFHRVYPNILVDYVDDLDFKDDTYLKGQYFIPPRKKHWDSKKIGAGAPPIKTKDGWLFIYQSVGHQDSGRYKIGAMLLDLNDPTKVLYRANKPIISPEEHYENNGFKGGVVYPCGAVVKDDTLFVYYGGADTVVCAASDNLTSFLDKLKYTQEPKLRRVRAPMLS